MKLIANNFTGFLPNANRYRVAVRTSHGYVVADFMVEKDGVFWIEDMSQSLYAEGYKTYSEALKKCLMDLESRQGIQLVKSEMKVA